MVTTMAGGARCNYLTPVCVKNAKGDLVPQPTSVFDMRKWVAAMRQYDTPALRVAVANAVRDGVIVANVVIDEPQNDGGPGNEGNSWGPKGTLNTARVDSLCTESKRINATLPAGPFQDYSVTATEEWKGQQYRVCDFAASQYRTAKGTLTAYRAGALAEWKRQGIAGAIGINVTDGGTPASRRKPDGTVKTDYAAGDCAQSSPGSYFPNCTMTAQQFRSTVDSLGSIACFLTGFKFVASYVAANQQSFRDAVTALQNRPRMSDPYALLREILLPEVELNGEGTVTPPEGGPMSNDELTQDQRRRLDLHKKEFKSRGLSDAEATRLAEEVLARDTPGASTKPLKLSPAAQAKLDKQSAEKE
jgi:hypothetical protein